MRPEITSASSTASPPWRSSCDGNVRVETGLKLMLVRGGNGPGITARSRGNAPLSTGGRAALQRATDGKRAQGASSRWLHNIGCRRSGLAPIAGEIRPSARALAEKLSGVEGAFPAVSPGGWAGSAGLPPRRPRYRSTRGGSSSPNTSRKCLMTQHLEQEVQRGDVGVVLDTGHHRGGPGHRVGTRCRPPGSCGR